MSKERKEFLSIVGRRVIPVNPRTPAIDDNVWGKIEWRKEQRQAAERLSQEKRKIYYETLYLIHRGLFDLSSGGIAHKLGLIIKLTEDEDLEQEDVVELCKYIGKSNFYVSGVVLDVAKGKRADSLFPSWFFDHFSDNETYRNLFFRTNTLMDNTERELAQTDENVNINNLKRYAF